MLSYHILTTAIVFSATVLADCCSPLSHTDLCADATIGTPNCGYGRCNIFGCNCDGGCRIPASDFCTTVLSISQDCIATTEASGLDYCRSYLGAAVELCLGQTDTVTAAAIQAENQRIEVDAGDF